MTLTAARNADFISLGTEYSAMQAKIINCPLLLGIECLRVRLGLLGNNMQVIIIIIIQFTYLVETSLRMHA